MNRIEAIIVPKEHNEVVQKWLFRRGFVWNDTNTKNIMDLDEKFIIIYLSNLNAERTKLKYAIPSRVFISLQNRGLTLSVVFDLRTGDIWDGTL